MYIYESLFASANTVLSQHIGGKIAYTPCRGFWPGGQLPLARNQGCVAFSDTPPRPQLPLLLQAAHFQKSAATYVFTIATA